MALSKPCAGVGSVPCFSKGGGGAAEARLAGASPVKSARVVVEAWGGNGGGSEAYVPSPRCLGPRLPA